MKLRNKKTGEIGKLHCDMNVSSAKYGVFEDTDIRGHYWEYGSLAELNEEWEDYMPKEPLIKDEKVREAVRAWAEANGIGGCICKEEIHCITFETERGMFISFEDADPIPPEGNYTIDELCGEKEE